MCESGESIICYNTTTQQQQQQEQQQLQQHLTSVRPFSNCDKVVAALSQFSTYPSPLTTEPKLHLLLCLKFCNIHYQFRKLRFPKHEVLRHFHRFALYFQLFKILSNLVSIPSTFNKQLFCLSSSFFVLTA